MKRLYSFLFIFLSFLSINELLAGNKSGKIFMYARLSGANEVPAVTTTGKGLVTFSLDEDYKTLSINGVFDKLSGAVTACHFHIGFPGSNGSVTVNLFSLVKGNQIEGKITVTKALLAAISNLSIYINVHTAANSSGEIRGQVFPESDLHFNALLSSANEVPTNTSTALGLGSFVLNYSGNKLEYKVQVTGLTGAIRAAHLHTGKAGKNGLVVIPLSFSGTTLSGTADITPALVDSLLNNKIYVNVHTVANAGGEIRGQLTFSGLYTFDVEGSGANEVPAKVSPGKALGIGVMNGTLDTLTYSVLYDSIVPTVAHFHAAPAGVNGSVIIPFTVVPGSSFLSGRVAVDATNLAKIFKGEV
jgi:hypothetical protein